MTPIGHFATSMTAGTVAWKISGSPVAGAIAAFLTHNPADLLFNEFYDWGNTRTSQILKKLKLFLMLIPAMFLYYSAFTELGAYQQMWFGLIGIAMDVDDVIKAIFGLPIFPCHPGSPFYIPAVWLNHWEPRMLNLYETALWESLLAVVAVITIIIMF